MRWRGGASHLRLPGDERLRVLESVSELEAEHAVLRQRRVACVELRLVWAKVAQRAVLVAQVLLVVDDAVAVGEGPSLDVLPRDAHVVALEQQRRPRQLLAQRPIDALATLDHLCPLLVHIAHLAM